MLFYNARHPKPTLVILYAEKNLWPYYNKDAYMQPFWALASMDAKKNPILHPQTQLYLFYNSTYILIFIFTYNPIK